MSAWPQFDRWMAEQKELIAQTGRDYPPLALDIVEDPGPTGDNKNQNGFIAQEATMFDSDLTEVISTQEKPPQGPHCEYCGTPLKEAKQARAIHLRHCQAYKLAKVDQDAPPYPAAGTNGQDVILTPERASKLWQAVTGGTLVMTIEAGQVVCRVSKSSFDKALPVLLDLL
ncbi:MAG: hypothetical protein BroJett011_62470 [Chloroflexota bacterium]|nr:MAG: hypothetical protein BroJett011_62470 [Chloroflexota bacterium]